MEEGNQQHDHGPDHHHTEDNSYLITLKVNKILSETTTEDLREEFSKYGEVIDVFIPRNYRSNDSRGFAFVSLVSNEQAEVAIKEFTTNKFEVMILKKERRQIEEQPNILVETSSNAELQDESII